MYFLRLWLSVMKALNDYFLCIIYQISIMCISSYSVILDVKNKWYLQSPGLTLSDLSPSFSPYSLIYRQLDEERRLDLTLNIERVNDNKRGKLYFSISPVWSRHSLPPPPLYSTQMSAAKSEINEDVTLGTISSKLFVTSNWLLSYSSLCSPYQALPLKDFYY